MSTDTVPENFLATPPLQAPGLSKVALPGLLQSADEPDGSTLVQGQGLFHTSCVNISQAVKRCSRRGNI